MEKLIFAPDAGANSESNNLFYSISVYLTTPVGRVLDVTLMEMKYGKEELIQV